MSTWKITRSFILPVTVLVLIPWAIHTWLEPLHFTKLFAGITGFIFLLVGLSFLAWTNVLFVAYGDGTLAPWDAPKKLVVLGPYRFVRNPMIIGVVTALWGEAMLFGSFYIFGWSILFWLINHFWFVYREEPQLTAKFGDAYTRYMEKVPRWIPLEKPAEYEP